MPWLVSIRMIGQVMGARTMVATRRSVIFRSEGLEFLFTFWTAASRVSSAQNPAARAPAAPRRNERRFFKLDFRVFMTFFPRWDVKAIVSAAVNACNASAAPAQGGLPGFTLPRFRQALRLYLREASPKSGAFEVVILTGAGHIT